MKNSGWIAIVAAIVLYGSGFRLFAEAADEDIVRVGYYEDGDYMTRNKDGEYPGFNFEFLQEIAKFAGFSYEVVDGVSWCRDTLPQAGTDYKHHRKGYLGKYTGRSNAEVSAQTDERDTAYSGTHPAARPGNPCQSTGLSGSHDGATRPPLGCLH